MAAHLTGSGGALLSGFRVATELGGWEASTRPAAEGGGFRVVVQQHTPDPFEWEYRGPTLTAELEVGRVTLRGPALLECAEPLIFVLQPEED